MKREKAKRVASLERKKKEEEERSPSWRRAAGSARDDGKVTLRSNKVQNL